MTGTPCQSAALDRIVAPWAAKIAAFFGVIVATIVANAENVRITLPDLGACCRKAGRRHLALCSGLSRPMMAKLETIGDHATLLRAAPSGPEPSRRLMTILVAPELNDAEASGDDRGEKLIEVHDIGSERQTCPDVKSSRSFAQICECGLPGLVLSGQSLADSTSRRNDGRL